MFNEFCSRLFRAVLLGGLALGLAVGCASSADDTATDTATDEVVDTAAVGPTAEPTPPPTLEPTAEPTQPPTREPTAVPPTAVPEPTYDFSAISPIVQAFVDEEGLNGAGLIVVQADDGVVHEGYWGEFSADRISLIASSSKMITAGVLLHLADEGVIDMDAPVADVVDWGAENPDITPAQLLSNSSGLVGLLPDPAYGPYVCQFLAVGTLEDCAAAIFSTPDDDADIAPPDSEFRYGGAQWQVAGGLAEAVSGQTWDELIHEIYVEPCELETLGYNDHFTQIGSGFDYPTPFNSDPGTLADTANPNMEGGAYVTTGDYAKLLLMHLRAGMCGDTQVLSTDALAAMHGDRIASAYDGDGFGPTSGYGMGWWVDRESGRITDGGAYGSVPWLDLDDGYGAYLVIEADSGTGNALASELYDVVHAAVIG